MFHAKITITSPLLRPPPIQSKFVKCRIVRNTLGILQMLDVILLQTLSDKNFELWPTFVPRKRKYMRKYFLKYFRYKLQI